LIPRAVQDCQIDEHIRDLWVQPMGFDFLVQPLNNFSSMKRNGEKEV